MSRLFLTIMAGLTALAIHLLVATTPAFGEAGDRKIFAAGVGARALSLGSAYCAAADDATAIVWNPAALAHVCAKEVAFYTTTTPVDGISYAFFGYAHPTLRFGTLGLGAVRFSAGGIEGRDDRNFVTTDAIKDVQMRWLFSYSNRLSQSVTYGVGLKVDTHTLAGASATSVGADLALLYRPDTYRAAPFSMERLGLALRLENALGPREKLGVEAVPDPTALHTGVSYQLPFGRSGAHALALLEWVREEGGEQNVLMGAEFERDGIALRSGVGENDWTVGGGVRRGPFRFDYAYAPGELLDAHRFSLHYAFGPTVSEMLAAAEEREEQEINDRLAREIGARETERVSALVETGKKHLDAGRYEEAREAFEGALLFLADDAEVQGLLNRAREAEFIATAREQIVAGDTLEAVLNYRKALDVNPGNTALLAEVARINAARDESREADAAARAREAEGVTALAAGRHKEAIEIFDGLVAADPDNADLQRLRSLASAGLGNEVDLLVSQGSLLMERGLLARGIEKLKQALELAPQNREARNRLQAAQAMLAKRGDENTSPETSVESPTRKEPLSAAEAAEVASMYDKGVAVFKAGRTSEAIEYWEIVWRRDPTHGDVGSYLTKGYLIQGMEHYTDGRLPQAIEVWQRALDVDPNDEKTRHYIERATSELAKTREISSR